MKTRMVSWPRVLAVLAALTTFVALAVALPGAHHAAQAQSSSRSGGYVGVLLQDLDEDLRDSYNFKGDGVLITEVTDGGPAEKAGLKRGDIVTSYRGRPVNSMSDLTDRVRADKAGDRAAFTVWRDGRPQTVTVTLGSREDMPSARWYEDNDNDNDNDVPYAPRSRTRTYHYDSRGHGDTGDFEMFLGGQPRLGVEIQDLDPDLGSYFNRADGKGVLVTHVVDDTPARRAGIRSGDVITELDGKAVDDADDLRKLLREHDAGTVRVGVIRKGTRQTITATLAERSDPMAWGGRNWMFRSAPMPPRGMSADDRRALERQMDDLRKQMDELRDELKKMDHD